MGRTNSKQQSTRPSEPKRVYLQLPANWDTLTPVERERVAAGMADELQRRLGAGPYRENGR